MKKQNKIGLAVIVHNEVELIAKFINDNYILDIFSEIKFLDDYSTDGTYEFLKLLEVNGVEIFQRKLDYDFSAQRNYLSKLMKSDYICRLDVDEIMNENLINLIEEGNLDKEFYKILRKEYVDNQYLRDTPTPFIYKNISEIHWQNRIHEVIFGYKSIEILPIDCFIEHRKSSNRCEKQNKFYYNGWQEQRDIVDKKD